MTRRFRKGTSVILTAFLILTLFNVGAALGANGVKTYTTTADFNEGIFTNTVGNSDAVKLDDTTIKSDLIWVAVSGKGTVVKIDINSGQVLGEYLTSPAGQPKNPSRTTVDNNGSVWVTNRDGNSITRVCTQQSGLWIDKNGNGVCDTSTGFGDIKPWTNAGGADSNGGVSTAQDECIINYVRVSSSGTRHVSIDADNNVWVSGIGNRIFNKINGVTGAIMRTEGPVGIGGYGGLIDSNNVIWSSTSGPVLRWDTANSLTGAAGGNWQSLDMDGLYGYGLGIDPAGNVWVTTYGNGVISKFAPDGTLIGRYNEGNAYAQGCVADSKGDIWVAHSLNSSTTVGHLKNDGTYVGTVAVGSGPTGVAVDANGKIWATNYDGTVSRIDPNAGPLGPDGVTHVGAADYKTPYLGGFLYNYSDMTGSTIQGAPNVGTWTATYNSGVPDVTWGTIDWNGIVSGNGVLGVKVTTSNDNVTYGPLVDVTNGATPAVPAGQYMKVVVSFTRAATGESPVLEDITVRANVNAPPVAEAGGPYAANEGSAINFDASASTDPDGDALMYRWDVNGDGTFESDWSSEPTYSYTFADDYAGNATLEVKDAEFTVSDTAQVTVSNVAPDVGDIVVATACVKVNAPINASAPFSDPGILDTHNATWDWGDGTNSTVNNISGTAAGSHTYTAPGVYTISVTVSDDDGGSDIASYQYIVVYDPSAGFVTGGGTIESPAGAYANDPSLSGKANFGFVSKYQKGANVPSGVTEFQFKAGDLNFHSNSYEWLVVAGSKAMFKGTGTINGAGEYGFMISAIDGSPDLFRIKIIDKATDTVVYDNQMGADADANPSTALTGGNIVVHAK